MWIDIEKTTDISHNQIELDIFATTETNVEFNRTTNRQTAMSRKENKQHHISGFTRNVLHGNAMNKRGFPSDFHKGGMRKERKVCYRLDRKTMRSIAMEKSIMHEFSDGVVVGKWDKKQSPMREVQQLCTEMKFTIPKSPNNRNVFENMVERATELKIQTLQELREKIQNESDREIWLID